MITEAVALVVGLVMLVWSADRFVLGASGLASNFGVSPLLIGMLIVGFGTSAPEIVVSVTAALGGNTGLAVGNALGSNIANIGLVLGSAALITPLVVDSNILRREFPVLLAVSVTVGFMFRDLLFTRFEGVILLIGLGLFLYWMYYLSTKSSKTADPLESEYDAEVPRNMPMRDAWLWTVAGLVLLVGSANILVWGAVGIAKYFGVSDLLIGLTIVAVGTSLPEIAVSISAALKKEHEIVLGNVIGSNLFNLLAVLGLAGVIHPASLESNVFTRDLSVMLVGTLAIFVTGYGFRGKGKVNRIEATLLLLGYFAYMYWLYRTEIKVA